MADFKVIEGTKSDLPTNSKPTTFVGTPLEVESFLRTFFELQRQGIIGATTLVDEDGSLLKDEDGNYVPDERQADFLDQMERGVWQIDIRPVKGYAKSQVRDDTKMMRAVERIKAERELYELMGKGELAKDKQD